MLRGSNIVMISVQALAFPLFSTEEWWRHAFINLSIPRSISARFSTLLTATRCLSIDPSMIAARFLDPRGPFSYRTLY